MNGEPPRHGFAPNGDERNREGERSGWGTPARTSYGPAQRGPQRQPQGAERSGQHPRPTGARIPAKVGTRTGSDAGATGKHEAQTGAPRARQTAQHQRVNIPADASAAGRTRRDEYSGASTDTGFQNAPRGATQAGIPVGPAQSRVRAEHHNPRKGMGAAASRRVRAATVALHDKTGRAFPLVLVGIAIVVLAALIGGVIAVPRLVQRLAPATAAQVRDDPYSPLPGPSPTPQANFTAFTSAHAHYSLNYPTGWSVATQTQTAQGQPDFIDIFLQATANPTASFYVEQATAAARVTDEQVITSEVNGAQQGGATLTPISGQPTVSSIGGGQWQRRDYTVTANGKTSHEVILACHHAGQSYVVVYIAPTSSYDAAVKSYFTPTLQSFRFLK